MQIQNQEIICLTCINYKLPSIIKLGDLCHGKFDWLYVDFVQWFIKLQIKCWNYSYITQLNANCLEDHVEVYFPQFSRKSVYISNAILNSLLLLYYHIWRKNPDNHRSPMQLLNLELHTGHIAIWVPLDIDVPLSTLVAWIASKVIPIDTAWALFAGSYNFPDEHAKTDTQLAISNQSWSTEYIYICKKIILKVYIILILLLLYIKTRNNTYEAIKHWRQRPARIMENQYFEPLYS